jgi:protein arginine N-methyltransferase 1
MSNAVYSLANYGEIMADPVRMTAYAEALRAACRPGCVVLDLGTGTGILALLSCRLEARRVYALDSSDVIDVAREMAQANGVADRITFLQGMSTDISLPEPVDVIVADVRGVLPMTGNSLATMIDARRFVAPGGIIIPARDTIRGVLVEYEKVWEDLVSPWRRHAFGFDASAAERLVLNTWRKARVPGESLLTEARDAICLDYAAISNPNVWGSFTADVVRSGTAHGLCFWFETTLFGAIGFSNEPGEPPAIYGQGFFPLPAPVSVDAGDTVEAGLRASLVHDDYVWSWETTISSPSGSLKARSAQSTFHASPLSATRLRKLAADARPSLGINGAIDRFILVGLDGRTTLAALAESLYTRFPDRFPDLKSALARVTAVAGRYFESEAQ